MTVCTMRQVYGAEPALIEPAAALLIDAVHSGASVGFLAPLTAEDFARRQSLSLLKLDTLAESRSEGPYRHLG